MIEVVDMIRIALAVLALVLGVACGAAMVLAPTWDQRGRFAVVLGYASIIVGEQFDAPGQPPTWRTWALAAVTAFAVLTTGVFLIRHVRGNEGRPDDGRSADDQRRLLRPRARARRARDAGNGARSKGRRPTS